MSWQPSETPSASTSTPPTVELDSQTRALTRTIAGPWRSSTRSNAARLTTCAAILASVCVTFARWPSALASEPQITIVEKGNPAPFTGDLYPVAESVMMTLALESCQERAGLDLDRTRKLHAIELQRQADRADAHATADRRQIELLEAQIEAQNAWYRSPPVVAAVTAAVSVAALLVSAVLVQATARVSH